MDISLEESLIKDSISESDSTSKEYRSCVTEFMALDRVSTVGHEPAINMDLFSFSSSWLLLPCQEESRQHYPYLLSFSRLTSQEKERVRKSRVFYSLVHAFPEMEGKANGQCFSYSLLP